MKSNGPGCGVKAIDVNTGALHVCHCPGCPRCLQATDAQRKGRLSAEDAWAHIRIHRNASVGHAICTICLSCPGCPTCDEVMELANAGLLDTMMRSTHVWHHSPPPAALVSSRDVPENPRLPVFEDELDREERRLQNSRHRAAEVRRSLWDKWSDGELSRE